MLLRLNVVFRQIVGGIVPFMDVVSNAVSEDSGENWSKVSSCITS